MLVVPSRNDLDSFLVIQLWENLPLFVAVDTGLFIELKHHQWRQSWPTWDGDIETLRHHVNTQLHSYSRKKKRAVVKTVAMKTRLRSFTSVRMN